MRWEAHEMRGEQAREQQGSFLLFHLISRLIGQKFMEKTQSGQIKREASVYQNQSGLIMTTAKAVTTSVRDTNSCKPTDSPRRMAQLRTTMTGISGVPMAANDGGKVRVEFYRAGF
jgi:hypothetical protein